MQGSLDCPGRHSQTGEVDPKPFATVEFEPVPVEGPAAVDVVDDWDEHDASMAVDIMVATATVSRACRRARAGGTRENPWAGGAVTGSSMDSSIPEIAGPRATSHGC